MKEWLRKNKFLLLIIISILAVVGVTFAFFQPQLQNGVSNDVDINANTTDDLQFNISNDISLNINQFNFGINAGNLSSNATATATLLANNSTNTATYTYYVYFRINYNEFVYTSFDSKPEIILSITNPSGQEVTSVEGLNYVTASGADGTQVKGFDITTATGAFAIATNYSITANSTTPTVQEWKLTATFINLDSDQQANTGKTMDAEILIQKDELTPEEKATFILSLNQLTKTIVKDAIDNQNEAYDLLKSEGMEGTQADIQQIFDSRLEDMVANSNQLNRVRTELKNKKEPE